MATKTSDSRPKAVLATSWPSARHPKLVERLRFDVESNGEHESRREERYCLHDEHRERAIEVVFKNRSSGPAI